MEDGNGGMGEGSLKGEPIQAKMQQSVLHILSTIPLLIAPSTAITQTAVRLILAEQDNHELQSGLPYALHEEVTGSQLIVMGIDLEDAQ
jgi:hypothetical protein